MTPTAQMEAKKTNTPAGGRRVSGTVGKDLLTKRADPASGGAGLTLHVEKSQFLEVRPHDKNPHPIRRSGVLSESFGHMH